MTIKECYEKVGSDYDGVLKRLGSEALVKRFAVKFLNDPSFQELTDGLAAQDGEKAFRAAHTLKGVCLNLGFTELYKVSAELTEVLRGRETAVENTHKHFHKYILIIQEIQYCILLNKSHSLFSNRGITEQRQDQKPDPDKDYALRTTHYTSGNFIHALYHRKICQNIQYITQQSDHDCRNYKG